MSTELTNGIYLLKNLGSGKYLNVWGVDQVGNSRNVNQYDLSAELSQVFWVQKTASGVLKLSSIIADSTGSYYALNINTSTYNANLYKEVADNDSDSALVFECVDGSNYRVFLKSLYGGNRYALTALGDSNGTSAVTQVNGNVVWQKSNSASNYQVWTFEYMAPYSKGYDIRKLDAQIFLHKFYQSTCTINAKAGSVLCTELTKALQKILLDLPDSDPGFGTFGEKTLAACPTLQLGMESTSQNKKLITLFCHAMFCKGYSTTAIYDAYNANIAAGVKKLQADMGLTQTGIVTPAMMKAVFNADSYVLSSKGNSRIREIQQAMNSGYSEYSGINPCDGIYSRATNKAMIYAIQKEEGISVADSAPSFGSKTFGLFPTLPFTGDSKETGKDETRLTKILQYALYVNEQYTGPFDGVYSADVQSAVKSFQSFMAYPGTITTSATARVMKGLLASCGDTSRDCTGCDTATIITEHFAHLLKVYGYSYVGRYLTGTVRTENNQRISKALTVSEADVILAEGLHIIPIYQDGGTYISYFTQRRGSSDAEEAYVAAKSLGIPDGTTIYFAVDLDVLDTQIDSVVQYFLGVSRNIHTYNVGVYGTRNVCARVINAGYASKCYVSDMSTGYSGNLGFKMPNTWAFDQFGQERISGIEIDRVAVSGFDAGVSALDNSGELIDEDAKLDSAIRSKVCDFEEDIPALRLLPDVKIEREFKYTLVNLPNVRIDYALTVGANATMGNGDYTFTVTAGSIDDNGIQEIERAFSATKDMNLWKEDVPAEESENHPSREMILKMFNGIGASIGDGRASITIEMNTDGSATISLECLIPEFAIYKNLSVDYAQTISVTLKPVAPNSQNPSDNSVNVTVEELKAWFASTAENASSRLGVVLSLPIFIISDEDIIDTIGKSIVIVVLLAVIRIIISIFSPIPV